MNFQDLPEDIILIILKNLDQKSVVNLYETCQLLRNIICGYGGIKTIKLSMNSLATVNFLKTHFYLNMAHHFKELDMSGVPDLTKSALVPAIKKLKCLVKLNVSFTSINMLDLLPIYNSCSTIKDITINFTFPRSFFLFDSLSSAENTISELRDVFKELENVHFVGSNTDKLVATNLPKKILGKAVLKSLKFSLCWVDFYYSVDNQRPVMDWKSFNTERFDIFLVNWKDPGNTYDYDVSNCSLLDHIEGQEFIVISMPNLHFHSIYVTPIFEPLFKNKLNVTPNVVTELNEGRVAGDIAILCWKRDFKGFNTTYFSNLANDLRTYFPKCLEDTTPWSPNEHDWFYSSLVPRNIQQEPDIKELQFKKRRIATPTFCLNYDSELKEKHTAKLSLNFTESVYVTLSPSSEYLRKLTYLSLTGPVRYSLEFFNVLFRSCNNLETLNVEGSKFSPCAFAISRSIPLSRTLKNIRLLDKCIDFNTLFSALSQCRYMENIQITDESAQFNEIGNPILVFEKCDNLYCFSISAAMSDSVRTKRLKLFNKVKSGCNKPFVHVELLSNVKVRPKVDRLILFDPFISIFHVHPIKPI